MSYLLLWEDGMWSCLLEADVPVLAPVRVLKFVKDQINDTVTHGIINYINTKAKCLHLKNLRVKGLRSRCLWDLRYSQSCWYFRPSFVNCCPYNLLSGSSLTPLSFPVWISILYRRIQCVRGARMGFWVEVPLHVNFFRWRHFALPSMSLIFLRINGTMRRDGSGRKWFHLKGLY
jgi:hypothetical protein